MHITLDRIEATADSSSEATGVLQQKSSLIQHYLNHNFFKAVRNLKFDSSECVSDLLENYNVFTAEDQISVTTSSEQQNQHNTTHDQPIVVEEIDDEPESEAIIIPDHTKQVQHIPPVSVANYNALIIPEDDDFDESKRINSCTSDLLDFNEVDQYMKQRGNSIRSERSEQEDMMLDKEKDNEIYFFATSLINEIIQKV